jgi:hypothetical protein
MIKYVQPCIVAHQLTTALFIHTEQQQTDNARNIQIIIQTTSTMNCNLTQTAKNKQLMDNVKYKKRSIYN